jgi:methyltransferase (TIGR00027 family)
MPISESEIRHVSDTALMVAACRAHETELEDAFVRDPFAAGLAGDRGFAILRDLPHAHVMRIGITIRTRFLDDLLLEELNTRLISTVLSVGCGLDTRPWRLNLDNNLRWIEVDFADVLDYKDRLMQGEPLRCRRERLSVDVNDPAQREHLYQTAGSDSALMITEGLLLYLPGTTVNALAAEAFNQSAIHHWITDLTTRAFTRVLGRGIDPIASIQRQGWMISSKRSYITDVEFVRDRVLRMTGGNPPPPVPFPPGDPTGVIRFTRRY